MAMFKATGFGFKTTGFGALAMSAALMLASCAPSPRTEVARGLRYIGFDQRPADCIAREMDERLTPEQMNAVTTVMRKAHGAIQGKRSPMTALEATMELNDQEIVSVTLKAGLGCMMVN